MRIADLRNRVVVQSTSVTLDASGAPEDTWSAVGTRWAQVEPLTGREAFEARSLHSDVDHRITMRYDATVGAATPKHRLLWGSRAFDILSVVNVGERDEYLEFMAREAV